MLALQVILHIKSNMILSYNNISNNLIRYQNFKLNFNFTLLIFFIIIKFNICVHFRTLF